MEEFQNIFSRPLFTIIFRQKIVILGTDSILRVKTMYESAYESGSQVRRVLMQLDMPGLEPSIISIKE